MQRRLADQDALSAKKVAEFEQRSVAMLAQPCHDRIRMRFGFTGVPITTERTRSDVTLTQLQIAPTADARRTHAETFGSFPMGCTTGNGGENPNAQIDRNAFRHIRRPPSADSLNQTAADLQSPTDSFRPGNALVAARGIIVSHQTVRLWVEKFGRHFANEIRRRSAGKLGDKWYLDEVVISIGGKKHWLWRAVDQDGFVLDVLVQSRRNTKAAKRLMRKLLKGQGQAPRVMITDKLRSYGAAKRDIMPGVEHRSHKGLNNRAENSHQPIRRRERIMKRFKSTQHLQRFVSIHDPIANLFHIPRHDVTSSHHRELRTAAIELWATIARL